MFGANLWRQTLLIAAFAILYGGAIALVQNSYYQLIMTVVPVWAVMGLAWNLLSGYSGLVSFGHAAFFGLGAYFVALTQIHWGLSPWLGIPCAGAVGAVAGLVIGIPTFRLRGHYFALAMLAYPLALLYVFEWLGYQELTLPMQREAPLAYMQFEDHRVYAWLALALLIGAMVLISLIERSRFGLSLIAIKQDEAAAEAAGIKTLAWKLKAIVLSGAMAGMAGGFYAVVLLVVGDAASRIRHVGFRAGVDRYHVRRCRYAVGAGDWRAGAGAAERIPARKIGQHHSWHSGRRLWCFHHRRDVARARGRVLENEGHTVAPACCAIRFASFIGRG